MFDRKSSWQQCTEGGFEQQTQGIQLPYWPASTARPGGPMLFESGLGYAQGCGNVTDVIGIETIGIDAMYQDLSPTVTF